MEAWHAIGTAEIDRVRSSAPVAFRPRGRTRGRCLPNKSPPRGVRRVVVFDAALASLLHDAPDSPLAESVRILVRRRPGHVRAAVGSLAERSVGLFSKSRSVHPQRERLTNSQATRSEQDPQPVKSVIRCVGEQPLDFRVAESPHLAALRPRHVHGISHVPDNESPTNRLAQGVVQNGVHLFNASL